MGHQSKADLYQRTIDSYRANCYSCGFNAYSAEIGSRVSSLEFLLGALLRLPGSPVGRATIFPRQFRRVRLLLSNHPIFRRGLLAGRVP